MKLLEMMSTWTLLAMRPPPEMGEVGEIWTLAFVNALWLHVESGDPTVVARAACALYVGAGTDPFELPPNTDANFVMCQFCANMRSLGQIDPHSPGTKSAMRMLCALMHSDTATLHPVPTAFVPVIKFELRGVSGAVAASSHTSPVAASQTGGLSVSSLARGVSLPNAFRHRHQGGRSRRSPSPTSPPLGPSPTCS